jgi:hypothetical protein
MADKIAGTTAEWTKLETDARKQLAAAAQVEQKLAGALAAIDAKFTALGLAVQAADRKSAASPPAAKSKPEVEPAPVVLPDAPAPASAAPVGESASSTAAVAKADVPAATPKPPRKPRAPKKPKAEAPAPETPAPAEPVAGDLIAEPVTDEPPAPENFPQVPPEEGRPTPAPSADGLTRLTVVSYIGIGNKLYLRGEGPGLSWDKGVPLQFVSIGRWRWETGDADAAVTCKVYKNDKIEAPLGTLTLAPGTEQEVTAAF